MIRANRKSCAHKSKFLVALIAALAALGGGLQLLAPASAAALQLDCSTQQDTPLPSECYGSHDTGGAWPWEVAGDNGGSAGVDDGFGNFPSSDPDSNTTSHTGSPVVEPLISEAERKQAEEWKKLQDYVESSGYGLPTWITDEGQYDKTVRQRWVREECMKLRRAIKSRIKDIRGNDFDGVDRLNGVKDRKLNHLQDQWDKSDCPGALSFGI